MEDEEEWSIAFNTPTQKIRCRPQVNHEGERTIAFDVLEMSSGAESVERSSFSNLTVLGARQVISVLQRAVNWHEAQTARGPIRRRTVTVDYPTEFDDDLIPLDIVSTIDLLAEHHDACQITDIAMMDTR